MDELKCRLLHRGSTLSSFRYCTSVTRRLPSKILHSPFKVGARVSLMELLLRNPTDTLFI
ncbi:unnamed protein product [Lactuca saligna]|uniref:Uncharacterized protein n=1 Tax=Lactuca saligna TaxID=75948 RepID=A0AA35VCR3_LACSI|nr:unnamed protein product [Lactuca saligna]